MKVKVLEIQPKDTIIFQINNDIITESELLQKIYNTLQEYFKENNILLCYNNIFSEIDVISNNEDDFQEKLYKNYPELLGGYNKYDNLY